MDLSDLTYAMDKLNLYRAGQLGQLQSPQAMELYRQMYGAATSKPVQQGSKQLIQKGSLGALGRTGANLMGLLSTPVKFNPPLTPAQAMILGGGIVLDERNQNKAREQYIQNNLRRQAIQERIKNMPMTIQADPWYKWERLE